MTRYDYLWARWVILNNIRTDLNLISFLINFSCELGKIMTRYDFLWARWVILSNFEPTWTWPNFTFGPLFMWIGENNDHIWLPMVYMSDSEQCSNRLELYLISLLVTYSCELGQIMTRYDFLWARWVARTWPNFTFGQLFMWIGANNDQIWLHMGNSEQCSNRLELDLISLLVNFSCELGANNDQIWLPMG